MKNIVVIGGGTGTFGTLSALKGVGGIDMSAIVTAADSGGSTGRLRDEFGFTPVGDLRQGLAAFARENSDDQHWIRKLLLYRFSRGNGLEGHNLGNLILTALQDMTGSTARAVEIASTVFRLHGHIYPITTQSVQLVAEYEDGTIVIGQHRLDDSSHGGKRIVSVKISPRASIYPKAKDVIESADLIVVGPGDLFGSLSATLAVDGTLAALQHSKARLVHIMNLMTRYTETHHMSAKDHLEVLERYTGRPFDVVILHQGNIPRKILDAYKKQGEYPVLDDVGIAKRFIRTDLARTTMVAPTKGDQLRRSYLRHDPKKLRRVLKEIIQ